MFHYNERFVVDDQALSSSTAITTATTDGFIFRAPGYPC